MSKEKQKKLSEQNIKEILEILENMGKEKWEKRWKEHMAIPISLNPLSKNKTEQEKLLKRFSSI